MSRLINLPLDRPVSVLMLLLCLTVLGVVAVTQIPISFMPSINEPEIDISIPNPGSHPLENLRQIVQPIEEEVASIPGVRNIFGSAMIGSLETRLISGTTVSANVLRTYCSKVRIPRSQRMTLWFPRSIMNSAANRNS